MSEIFAQSPTMDNVAAKMEKVEEFIESELEEFRKFFDELK